MGEKVGPHTAIRLLPPGVTEQELPSCVTRNNGGLYVVDSDAISEGSPGPFQLLVNYGHSLEFLRLDSQIADLPTNGVWLPDMGNDSCLLDDVPVASIAAGNLTRLVNKFSPESWSDLNLGVVYAANFVLTAREALVQAREHVGSSGRDVILYAPLRGGKILWIMSQALGFDFTIPSLRASRVLLKDGSYMVGLDLTDYARHAREYGCCNKAIFADDCLAAGGSQKTILNHVWLDGLAQSGIRPNNMAVIAGVGVLRTANAVAETISGIKGEVFLGAIARSMNECYYLTLTPEERAIYLEVGSDGERMRVGDMGQIMSLQDQPRRSVLMPFVQRVTQGGVYPDRIIQMTEELLINPGCLEEIAEDLLKLTS